MTRSKKIDVICIVIMIIAVIITILFMNGKSLGLQVYVGPEDATEKNPHFTTSDMKKEADTQKACKIELDGDKANVTGSGAYFANGKLIIAYKGTYVLSGTLNGQIEVDADGDDKVWLVLNGLTAYCEDSAALYVKKADKVFINLAAGSVNTIESGSEFSKEAEKNKIKGAIVSKDDLTINGTGSLSVKCDYAHGIVCKDKLKITGGSVSVDARTDGIHVNDAFNFAEADLSIEAIDDGITVSNDDGGGEFYSASGTIKILKAYEGIEAANVVIDGGDIDVTCRDDGINATSKEAGTGITVNGGVVRVNNAGSKAADGLDSNMDIILNGGELHLSVPAEGKALDCGDENGGKLIFAGGKAYTGDREITEQK